MCAEYLGRTLKVQELWHTNEHKLNILLSTKGHPVEQRGAFTGIAIDTYKGQFSILPDKMATLVAALRELATTDVSTPRRIVQHGHGGHGRAVTA